LYLAADGKCTSCGIRLEPGWHADHVQPWSAHGATDVINGQALCPSCNLAKGSKVTYPNYPLPLREWQEDALVAFVDHGGDFLVMACPGAGKTTFALAAARKLIDANFQQVIVVVPTSHLRSQWASAAQSFGIDLDYAFTNGNTVLANDYQGAAVTYAMVAREPSLWRKIAASKPTLVILDEIHHAGEDEHLTWGPALREAFGSARRRLLLSGTPVRTDGRPIPFVEYVGGLPQYGFKYEYGDALRQEGGGVVRPLEFLALDGQVGWKNPGSGVQSTKW
jgi:superfamily II DNA or RNA helicase